MRLTPDLIDPDFAMDVIIHLPDNGQADPDRHVHSVELPVRSAAAAQVHLP